MNKTAPIRIGQIGQTGTDNTALLADVLDGLAAPSKHLPAKYFYDQRGCELFDAICQLDEYYLYKTELKLLPEAAKYVAQQVSGALEIVELGAGSLVKIRLLLAELPNTKRYIPVDIAESHLETASSRLQVEFSTLSVEPKVADFTRPLTLPAPTCRRLGFFPGSTIGNFSPMEAELFLGRVKRTLGQDSLLLIGVDTKKDQLLLDRAYNDEKGVTAQFNLNILARINRKLGADFDLEKFRHRAFYDAQKSRVEMHLQSLVQQSVRVAGRTFEFAVGETIHTENSCKYAPGEFRALATAAGWRVHSQWQDTQRLFAVYLLAC